MVQWAEGRTHGRSVAGHGRSVAGAWPGRGQGAAGAWPVHGRCMARAWPGPTAQDTTQLAEMASTGV